MILKQAKLDELSDLQNLAHASGYVRYDSLYTLAELARAAQPTRILELGVYRGCSTVFLARATSADIVAVDDFTLASQWDVGEQFKRYGVKDRIRLVRGDTRKAGTLVDGPFDFVFFDACHTNEGVVAEYESVRPLLAPRALLVVDDALHVNAALTHMGKTSSGMRAYSVHFGLCAIIHEARP